MNFEQAKRFVQQSSRFIGETFGEPVRCCESVPLGDGKYLESSVMLIPVKLEYYDESGRAAAMLSKKLPLKDTAAYEEGYARLVEAMNATIGILERASKKRKAA